MTARPDALRYALAALALVSVIGLGARVYGQLNDLGDDRSDLADAARHATLLRAAVATGIGPPLLDARAAAPSDSLAQRLRVLGIDVRRTTLIGAKPAGRDTVVARFAVEGRADAAALDRLVLWTQANGRSAILESLSASAGADGKSDVTVQLDALVRQAGVRPS